MRTMLAWASRSFFDGGDPGNAQHGALLRLRERRARRARRSRSRKRAPCCAFPGSPPSKKLLEAHASIVRMNGAEALARTLVASGVDHCFANPGTSEMHFVSALDRVEGLRCVLGLAETVVAGCADGYARMAGKPAATLFHCGPGLGNAIANLHNAKRAFTPIVNIVGDHATYHRQYDAPLAADTEGLARTVST